MKNPRELHYEEATQTWRFDGCPERFKIIDQDTDCDIGEKFKPIKYTNADEIRNMTDEELAGLLRQTYTDGACDIIRSIQDISAHVNTISYYQNWLQQPAKEDV